MLKALHGGTRLPENSPSPRQEFKQQKAFPKQVSAYKASVYGNLNSRPGIIQFLTLQEEK